ncbi:DUF6515 family protein [Mangrovibacterium diazotrophicum]|uniref:WG repeat protein n=1 Tax=Mangrovibacterium diazotrophicum TaxID=1261403 RepID=A0A419WAA2_9BACT|nr:DUF6515 family protein [Mangrovibacterium diazotrophicum]RKD92398.1 hypothetical protein BC643_2769 [Mangrovibacterium diazotrophicum]
MKARKFLLIVALMIATVAVNAQSRNNGQNQKSAKQTTQQKQSSKNNSSSQRTVTVQSQPSSAKNVSRSQVSYRKSTPTVVAVRSQNQMNAQVIKKDNKEYYAQSGVYYRKYNDNYIKVAPPVGLNVQVLPQGSLKIVIGNRNYFYFEGVYYQSSGNGYIVETPPVGAIVYALPADYERVELDGQTYYEYNGVLYSRVSYQGERAYEVVGYLN